MNRVWALGNPNYMFTRIFGNIFQRGARCIAMSMARDAYLGLASRLEFAHVKTSLAWRDEAKIARHLGKTA